MSIKFDSANSASDFSSKCIRNFSDEELQTEIVKLELALDAGTYLGGALEAFAKWTDLKSEQERRVQKPSQDELLLKMENLITEVSLAFGPPSTYSYTNPKGQALFKLYSFRMEIIKSLTQRKSQ
jgi:hypothetical protein